MLIVLAGKSGSGKSTIASYIEDNFSIERIKTHTTRPERRDNPNDHRDYMFADLDIFLLNERIYTLIKKYETVEGLWYYGVKKSDLKGITSRDKLILLDPVGVRELKEQVNPKNIIVIYVDAPDDIRIERTLGRNDNRAEVERRTLADNEDFRGFKADYTIHNEVNDLGDLNDCVDYLMYELGVDKIGDI